MTKKQHQIALRILEVCDGELMLDALAAIEKLGKEWRKANAIAITREVQWSKKEVERRLKDGKENKDRT